MDNIIRITMIATFWVVGVTNVWRAMGLERGFEQWAIVAVGFMGLTVAILAIVAWMIEIVSIQPDSDKNNG